MTTTKTVPIKETDRGYAPQFDGKRYTNAQYDFKLGEVIITVPE